MVKLKIKGNKFKIDRIVAFGCSFTAGTEILDCKLDPYHFELKSKLGAFDWWNELKKDPEAMYNLNELRKQEVNHAWPAHLAKELGVDFINYALPGNSNEHAYWQVEKALADGKITATDLILVGRTSADRSMFFDANHENPVPFLFSHTESYENILTENILKYFTDDRIVWNYLRDLKSFESVRQQLNGRLFIVNTEPIANPIMHFHPSRDLGYGMYNASASSTATFLSNAVKQLYNSDLFMTTDHCLYDFASKKTRLPHGHLSEAAHIQFAQILLTNCITVG